jgi:glycosyltransferase involved in cell wall biosynthesis
MPFSKPSRPIRVAYVDHTALMSGGEIALFNLVTHLDRAVVDPVVILFSEGPLAEKLRSAGVETRVLPLDESVLETRKDSLGPRSLLRIGAAFASIRHAWRLRSELRQVRAAIVHANSLKADLIAGVAGRLAGAWVIWHVRDRIEKDYLPRTVVRAFRLLSRIVPHHVIANSQATLDTLHVDDSTVTGTSVVYSGVVIHDGTLLPSRDEHVAQPIAGAADAVAARDAASADADTMQPLPVVGLVGRISPWKGQDVLIRAAQLLRDRGVQARYRIIGSAMFGEEAYERELRAMVDAAGLAESIEFAGFKSNVAAEIAGLDVLVHTSKLPEPFGQVVVEGMAASKPVIATRAGGVIEIVEDGISGLLVEPDDAAALANALQRVLSEPALAARLGAMGRRRVERYFTIERVARDVESLYIALTADVSLGSTPRRETPRTST